MMGSVLQSAGTELNRREWMRFSWATLVGAATFPWLESHAAGAATPGKKKACILLWMNGGPSQMDTFDLKPGHENGGPYKEIGTSVPGIKISEHLPKLANVAEHLAIIRSMSTKEGDHGRATYLMRNGYLPQPPVRYPTLGALVAKELGNPLADLPSFVSISPYRNLNPAAYSPGFLGSQFAPLLVGETRPGADEQDERDYGLKVPDLLAPHEIAAGTADARLKILGSLNHGFMSDHPGAPAVGYKSAYDSAVRLMRSAAGKAFDLDDEPGTVRDAYGRNRFGQGCLLARRLVERGVPFVEVTLGGAGGLGWDTHADNFNTIKTLSGTLDPAWSTLINELKERGLLDSTLIVWMGEFGRTPKINNGTGRDHYPNAWSTVLAGGGIRAGQVVGNTSADGTKVETRPVSVADLLSTVFRSLGVDPTKQNISNVGRPIRLADPAAKPIEELGGMIAVVVRASVLVPLVACLAFCNSTEAADSEAAPRAATSDVQDLVVLGPLRPLPVRLHVTFDGRPFRERMERRFGELFDELDHDGDGRLTVAQGDELARDMNGSLRDAPRSIAKDSLLASAADENGTVDRRTLANYIQTILPAFGLRVRPVISQSSGLALLPLLDTNGDQQLSADELARAEEQLMQRDFNDDGVITAFELILDPAAQAAASSPEAQTERDSLPAPVLLVDGAATAESVADRLLKRYDRNDDGRVLTDGKDREMSLPAAILGRLDQNGDAALERGELLAFLDRPPDLELNLAMGAVSAADRRSSTRVRVEPGWRVRPTPRGGFKLKLGELDIDFVLNNRDPRQADFYDFNAMDADKNGYLEQRESDAGNIGRGSFESMDADGDKKVFKGEFTTFAEEQKAAAAVRLQMEVSDIGQDLFVMLDTDLDGVLSSRELRSAKNILALEDKNGDGVLGGDEIPERMLIEIVRGPEAPSDAEARVARGRTARSATKANTTGPRWFRKMDRNNDGDLSLREFVGPLEAFHKLDADGDGLIDREEAEAASPPSKQEN